MMMPTCAVEQQADVEVRVARGLVVSKDLDPHLKRPVVVLERQHCVAV